MNRDRKFYARRRPDRFLELIYKFIVFDNT